MLQIKWPCERYAEEYAEIYQNLLEINFDFLLRLLREESNQP